MSALRYDPTRLAPLRAAAAEALRHLLTAHSTDLAAASALRVVAAARDDLQHGWLPAIDRLVASDAMTAWTTPGPPSTRLTGRALGEALAADALTLLSFGSARAREDLVVALRRCAGDEEAVAAFVTLVGPDALLDLVVTTASDPDDVELPVQLRDAFVRAAVAGDVPVGFGRRLVHAARIENERAGGMGDGGLALSFLFHGAELPGALVAAALDEAVRVERAWAAEQGGGPDIGGARWQGTGPNAARALWADFDVPYRGDDLDAVDAQDPVYALLGQLARDGNSAAARGVFTDPERARYLFAERDVLADGGRAVVAAAANAAAGADVVATAPDRVLDDASMVASAFVNLFGAAHARQVGPTDRVATATARVVGTHLYGVQHAWGSDSTVTDHDRRAALPADRRDAATGRAAAAVAELANRAFGSARVAAVFDPVALVEIVSLAARTDAGVEALRADLSRYQQGIAAEVAARLAGGDIPTSEAPGFLAEVMADSARLEGSVVARVGDEAVRRGRDQDAVVSFWIGAIGEAADVGANLFGPGTSAVAGAGADHAGGALERTLAGAEHEAIRDRDTRADLAGERLAYTWLRELQAAGLIEAALAPGILVDGVLPPYDDLVVALATDGPPGWEVTTVIQQFDESSGGVADTDLAAVLDAMRSTQARCYDRMR